MDDDFVERLWFSFLSIVAIGIVALLGVAITADKHVDGYYLSTGGKSGVAVCVMAHWTWHSDETAYCSDDKDKALDFAAKANAIVKGNH